MRRYDGIFLLNFLSNKEKGEFAAAMMLPQGGVMFWMSFGTGEMLMEKMTKPEMIEFPAGY